MINSNSSGFELLESRFFLSSATLTSGTLLVRGGQLDDFIFIGLNDAGDKIEFDTNPFTAKFFDINAVRRIIIRALNGNDQISIGSGIGKPILVDCGSGDDFVSANDERDSIYGGAGDDQITLGDIANFVDGGDGNDLIFTGDGRDTIHCGEGNDFVWSGGGNDFVTGGLGDDGIDAGAGNDSVYGGHGNDTLGGGAGNDRLWGESGADLIDGSAGNDILGGIAGHNTLMGGSGRDIFVVRHSLAGQSADYDANIDILQAG